MTRHFLRSLIDEASRPFAGGNRFAYHYSRGKLSSDSIFREILKRGLFPAQGRYLDLGCGQGSLFAWLLAARKLYEQGNWPGHWPAAPEPLQLRGIELMQKDVDRAARAFGREHPLVHIEQGDMTRVDFGSVDVITILDALHYFDHACQQDVLKRIRAALPAGGLFLTRVGDASAGLRHRVCNWVDHAVTYSRGHRLPQLYCRPLADWVTILEDLGFVVETDSMNQGKPFANVMLVCRLPESSNVPH